MKKKHIREYRARSLFKYVCMNFNCVFLGSFSSLDTKCSKLLKPPNPKTITGAYKNMLVTLF